MFASVSHWKPGAESVSTAAEGAGLVRGAGARAADLVIAACALTHAAPVWTLHPDDFRDIAGLTLFEAPA